MAMPYIDGYATYATTTTTSLLVPLELHSFQTHPPPPPFPNQLVTITINGRNHKFRLEKEGKSSRAGLSWSRKGHAVSWLR